MPEPVQGDRSPRPFEVTLPQAGQTGAAEPRHRSIRSSSTRSSPRPTPTEEDPWAQAWLKENTAGRGAYNVETFKPGEQVILKRNDAWNRAADDKQAFFKRVDHAVGAGAGNARQPGRGAATPISSSICRPATSQSLEAKGKLKVISTPQYNAITFISMNNQMPPFDNARRAPRHRLCAAL